MQAALDTVIPYVHERKQFGQSIGEFQVSEDSKRPHKRKITYVILAHPRQVG